MRDPNVFALLDAVRRGEASALRELAAAPPPEAEGPAEAWLQRACAKGEANDATAVDAIALLRKLDASGAAVTIARALSHPNERVRDEAARAMGEFRFYPSIEKLRAVKSDAALEALEAMFQQRFYGGFWPELMNSPRRVNGRRDWTEFETWWADNEEARPEPVLLPEECTEERLVSHFLDRLPGSHRVFERHGYRCVARIGKDVEECVAVVKESVAEAARLHGKEPGPLLADLSSLSARIRDGR